MSDYRAPIEDMRFVIHELAGLSDISKLPGLEEVTPDLCDAVLEEAGRFASEVVAPLNWTGDVQGSRLEANGVVTADGWREAYKQFCDGGWNGITSPTDYGGQGLPSLLGTAVREMVQSANLSFSLGPMLTSGAVEALLTCASPELKATYLEKMVSGEWTGTMNLTEPQAGSDLALIRTRAEPQTDGTYRLFGQKIYITYGDHDMTSNIVHLVLARLPDAPPGVKGISLFLAPKFLVNADGSIGERNDLRCVSIEHKLGIHASPTCVMAFGDNEGAVAYLLGEPNQGLKYMFIMMNDARLGVGLQGVAIGERSYQKALSYARERKQGRDAVTGEELVTIDRHPDVRRMLMSMKSRTEACRAITYYTSGLLDRTHKDPSADERQRYLSLAEFLIPIVKGGSTEMSIEVSSLGIQIHGGMGFIEETGAAQHWRDARILTIYEGTTGVQAMDLIFRKLFRDGGETGRYFLGLARATAAELLMKPQPELQRIGAKLTSAVQSWEQAFAFVLGHAKSRPSATLAAAVPFLELSTTVCGGWLMGQAALISAMRLDEGHGNAAFYRSKLISACFYADHELPKAQSLLAIVEAGDDALQGVGPEVF
jgi:acyl-CoA dehydrogenase